MKQERRRQMESRIKYGLVEILHEDEAVRSDADDVIVIPTFPPWKQFVLDRLDGVPAERVDAAYTQTLADLLDSDLPLDKDARGSIAAWLRRLANPRSAKRSQERAELDAVRRCMAELERRGMAPADARENVAQQFGHASGEALRKWLEKRSH